MSMLNQDCSVELVSSLENICLSYISCFWYDSYRYIIFLLHEKLDENKKGTKPNWSKTC